MSDAPQQPPGAPPGAGVSRRDPLGGLRAFLRRAAAAVLRAGPVPRHVAFIMDGNRRFAQAHGLERATGHALGFDRLVDCLEWCLDLGVEVVSVYAFSIENFRRDPAEVATLMSLAERKLEELLASAPTLRARRARVRVLGDLALLPPRVAAAAARVAAATSGAEHASGPRVNICLAYTARAELAAAAQALHGALREGRLAAGDVSEALLEACLLTADEGGCPPVGLLLRTSGERRLSDFLLAQSGHALLVFQDVLWPDLAFRHLAAALLRYQRASRLLSAAAGAASAARDARRRGDALAALRAAASRQPSPSAASHGDDNGRDDDQNDENDDSEEVVSFGSFGSAAPSVLQRGEYEYDEVVAALLARYGPAAPWRGGSIGTTEEEAVPEESAEESAALDAQLEASQRRCAAFLRSRDEAAAHWVRLAAAGAPPPWPPALPPLD